MNDWCAKPQTSNNLAQHCNFPFQIKTTTEVDKPYPNWEGYSTVPTAIRTSGINKLDR